MERLWVGSNIWEGRRRGCGWEVAGRGGVKVVGGSNGREGRRKGGGWK
jgi:hypothetical protein